MFTVFNALYYSTTILRQNSAEGRKFGNCRDVLACGSSATGKQSPNRAGQVAALATGRTRKSGSSGSSGSSAPFQRSPQGMDAEGAEEQKELKESAYSVLTTGYGTRRSGRSGS